MDFLSEVASGYRLRFALDGANLALSLAVPGSGETIIQGLLLLEHLGAPQVVELWRAALEEPLVGKSKTSDLVWAAIRNNHQGVLRTAYGVLVCSERLVMEVFNNAYQRYTVDGYAPRMTCSFGKIYLGLDDGPDYQSQFTAGNASVGSISEAAAFDAAFNDTNLVLDGMISRAKLAAGLAPTWQIAFEFKDVSEPVLAMLSNLWFGIPDGVNVEAGGFDISSVLVPGRKPRCPGHFGAPSGYIFQPNPIAPLEWFGQKHGQALKTALDAFVAQHRTADTQPTQLLSSAIFAAFSNTPADNDMIARTIIGVMMGFLPTTDGNLREVVSQWLDDQTFERLHHIFTSDPAAVDHDKSVRLLKDPLMRAMQVRPVPPMVWRTALTDHALGDEPVDVHAGEKIVVSIISATQEANANGRISVFPIFGGDRSSTPHPTHACPGYKAAMGVMLGVVTALVARGVSPGLLPSTMALSGSNP